MYLSQIKNTTGGIDVVIRQGDSANILNKTNSTYQLVLDSIAAGKSLTEMTKERGCGASIDLSQALEENRIILPIYHPDPAHLYMTGTGLTHLGSAAMRDTMHTKQQDEKKAQTDSMKIFQEGIIW